ncbi:MAG: PPC domain-containing protein [Deltaproteobacteria bacterium]|nr:PPC domain-containing protein [Deltaproteobacteria bacterium]
MTFLRSILTPSLLLSLSLAGIAACGDNKDLDDPDRDDPQQQLTACDALGNPSDTVSEFPAIIDGTLAGKPAALAVGPGECGSESAPFGVEVPGPDSVVALSGLEPGAEYIIRLFSASDLAVYVLDGNACDSETNGLAAGSCLTFSDDTVQPPERASFVAPDSGTANLVIDYFLAASPVVGDYSIDVYQSECSEDSECTGDNGFCVDNRCVACASSFDCTQATDPICDLRTNSCVAGDDTCTDDDGGEGFNDGPAGATDVTPVAGVGESASSPGKICNSPSSEVDYFSFVVADGESVTVELDWPDKDNLDMDFGVFDSTGRQLGASLWRSPEVITLTYLPAGTYYAQVNLFGGNIMVAQDYTVTVTRDATDLCVDASDCAAEYDTQLYRGDCNENGACIAIDNETPAASGESCDTGDDCDSGRCSAFSFTADADTRAVCSNTCTADGECTGLGEFVCTDYLLENMCVPKCTTDDQCAVLIGNQPTCDEGDTACLINPPTWTHLTCDVETGRCEFPQ